MNRPFEFVFEIKNLNFFLGELEPFYARLFLFDVSTKKRISENFYFDLNTKKIRDLLGNHLVNFNEYSFIILLKEPIDPASKVLHAIFAISQKRTSDICLVLQVEKVINFNLNFFNKMS